MLDNCGFFSFPSSLEFNGVPCYSFQSSMRSCSPLFARRQRMVWLQNMLRVLYSTHFVGWPECIQMALAGKGGIVFKLSWLFLSISLVEKIVLYNFLKYATCFHSSKEGNDSLLSKTRKCVSDIIRVCFFEAGRSIAHKCARFLALCIRLVLIICICLFLIISVLHVFGGFACILNWTHVFVTVSSSVGDFILPSSFIKC